MDDLVWPAGWTQVCKNEFIEISDRGEQSQDLQIRCDIRKLVEFSKSLMRIIDRLEKALESYDRDEVARF